jgi:hypothetical protein
MTTNPMPSGMPDLHSFESTFISIIVGLIVARVLHSLAVLIKCRGRCRITPIVPMWLCVILLYEIHWWWGLVTWAHLGRSMSVFLVSLLSPMFAYLAVEIFGLDMPETATNDARFDLTSHYASAVRGFLVFASLAVAASIPPYVLLPNIWDGTTGVLLHTMNAIRGGAALLLLGLAFIPAVRRSDNRSYVSGIHYAGVVAAGALLLTFIVYANQRV